MFNYIVNYDCVLIIWLNLIFLLLIAFIPFVTTLIGRFPGEFISVAIYAIVVVCLGVARTILWWYASKKERLIISALDKRIIRLNFSTGLIPAAVFAVSIVIAIFSPIIAMYSWLAIIPLMAIVLRGKV